MVFAMNIARGASHDNDFTYNFNKSINQYFISGICVQNGYDYAVMYIYDNGTGGSFICGTYNSFSGDHIHARGNAGVTGSASSINVSNIEQYDNKDGCKLYAVLIYPAIYGDVTIS